MLARYLERLMIAPNNEQKSAIDEEFLAKHGFM